MSSCKSVLLATALSTLLTGVLQAQSTSVLTLIGGASQYDLSGTGTAPFLAVRAEKTLVKALIVEGGLEYFTYKPDFGDRRNHILPEVMLQLQLPAGSVRPYIGGGVGASILPGVTGRGLDLTLAAAGGLRVMTRSEWSLRGELRVRAIRPWGASTADWGVGLSRSF